MGQHWNPVQDAAYSYRQLSRRIAGSGPRFISSGRCCQGITLDELALVPVRINWSALTGRVQTRDLLGGQVPSDCCEVLPQLFFVASANNNVGNRGPLQQPIERNLRDGFVCFLRYLPERID